MRTLLLSLSVITLLSLASCKEDTIVDPVIQDKTIAAGSTFTFEHSTFSDTLWSESLTADSITYTVASIDTIFAGEMKSHYLWATEDTNVYKLDAQNDLAIYQPEIPIPGTGVVYPESWPAVPVATKQALIVYIDEDTAVSMSGYPAIVHTRLVSGYLGSDSITVGGKSFTTEVGYIERNVIVGIRGFSYSTKVYTEYEYSAKLGTIVARRQKVWSNHDMSPIPNGGETWTLVNFAL